LGDRKVVIGPKYYNDRMKEARALVNELREPG
jgi:hypothetical protein